MELSIAQLVEKAGRGDQQAVTMLYEKTNRKAYYLAMQLVKDQDQAQDILQDAYLKVFSSLHMLQQPENFQGWLDTIVINKSKDYLKKKKPVLFSQMANPEEPDQDIDFEDQRETFSPEKQVDYKETKRLVQAMIDGLPEEQRMAVVLFYLENMPVKQIARFMECSEGTIKSRLNYGRKSIKNQVLELEKKGTKLYCMPLIPFLYWMFGQQAASVAVPAAVGKAVLVGGGTAAAKSATGTVSGTAAGKTAAATAVKAGTAAAGKGMAVKAAAIVAAVCVAGGGAAAGYKMLHPRQSSQTAASEAATQNLEQQPGDGNQAEGEAKIIELTKEEQEALNAVYEVFESGAEPIQLIRTTQEQFDVLHDVVTEKFDNKNVVFNGETAVIDGDGSGILIKESDGSIKSNRAPENDPLREQPYERLTVYGGSFEEGLPEGQSQAVHVRRCDLEYRYSYSSRQGWREKDRWHALWAQTQCREGVPNGTTQIQVYANLSQYDALDEEISGVYENGLAEGTFVYTTKNWYENDEVLSGAAPENPWEPYGFSEEPEYLTFEEEFSQGHLVPLSGEDPARFLVDAMYARPDRSGYGQTEAYAIDESAEFGWWPKHLGVGGALQEIAGGSGQAADSTNQAEGETQAESGTQGEWSDEQIQAAWTAKDQELWQLVLYSEPENQLNAADLGKDPQTLSNESKLMFCGAAYYIMEAMSSGRETIDNVMYAVCDQAQADQVTEECFGFPIGAYLDVQGRPGIMQQSGKYYLNLGDWGTMWPYVEIRETEVKDGCLRASGYRGWETDDEENTDKQYEYDSSRGTWISSKPFTLEFSYHPEAVYSHFRLENIRYE